MADDTNAPRAPIQGVLKLTRTQEDRLMKEAIERRQKARDAMGFRNNDSGIYDLWLGIRQNAWDEYRGDFSHRRSGAFASLFKLYNSSCEVPRRAARMFKARARDAILGASPVVSLEPEGDEDIDPAVKSAGRYLNRKLIDAGIHKFLPEAVEQACVSGEAVMKIARNPAKAGPPMGRVWITGGVPMFDEATGQEVTEPEVVVIDDEGRPVSEHDAWEPDADLPGQERLKAKPKVKKPPGARLSEDVRDLPPRAGWAELNISVIPYQDFICDPNAPSLEQADYRGHSFQWEEGVLRSYLAAHPGANMTDEVEQWLMKVHRGETKPLAESQQPRESQGEERNRQFGGIPKTLMEESWMRFDLDDDGKKIVEVCLMWDVLNEFPLAYDYMTVATSLENEIPFKVIRIIPAKNRWGGLGFYEFLLNAHGFIDRQWNRIDNRSGSSGSFKWHLEGAIEEVARGIPLELNSNRVYTINKAFQEHPEKAFGVTAFPEMDQNIWAMLQQMTQNAQTLTGTTQPTDAAASDLNQSDTLGEQELINQEGDIVNGDIMADLKEGIVDTLKAGNYVVFAKTITESDANLVLGSERASQLLRWLPGKVSHLSYYLSLTLKKESNKRQMVAYEMAITRIVGDGVPYYTLCRQDPPAAEQAKPLYEGYLNCYNVPNVEKILKPLPALMPVLPPGSPNAAPTSPAAPPLPAAPVVS